MRIQCIVFDCDGVLVNSEELAAKAELEILHSLGLGITRYQYNEIFLGLSDRDHFMQIKELLESKLGIDAPSDLEKILHRARWSQYRKNLTSIPGAIEFLGSFTGELALVSSSSRNSIAEKLQLAKLDHFFGAKIISSDDVRSTKPSPEPYESIKSKITTPVENCLVVEDSENGVRSAVGAGFRTWGFLADDHGGKYSSRLSLVGAEKVVLGYEELSYCVSTKL
ncbi:HAD family phosphatase [Roseibacterium beibuensis]|uniref:HAD family phosphatase n=1 Tax=[Roseibacterium] beibuensis TaxID=1193142 RepID=A0ABP9LNA2_9RHOB|nr:HAD family phosphatase [Roseibacterium beibuensis]MCS6627799.1 HAD family phosphatase [Roseibacterium beibuensis]